MVRRYYFCVAWSTKLCVQNLKSFGVPKSRCMCLLTHGVGKLNYSRIAQVAAVVEGKIRSV